MFLVIVHAEIVLYSFSFVMLPCDVIFLFHCSLKSEDLVIQAALIKKYLKDRSPIDTTHYFQSQIFVASM